MVVSDAKLEANRRNAQKSTGPRTEQGKKISSLNAVTYGLRAETLVLHDEDPQVLEDRRAAWRACLSPGDDVEERLVDDAVVYTWQQDRARRAQAKRIDANFTNYGVDQGQTDEKDVEDLGRRLFTDRLGPVTFYPTGCGYDEGDWEREPSTSFAGNGEDDPDQPSVLVLSLQSTLLGCEWMLGEWAKLKAILDQGQSWLSSDKLKAVRLLGKQPFDAIDVRDVAMVFLASFELRKDKAAWFWEIATELAGRDIKRFRQNAADRQLESLKPADAAQARQVLLGIIERATEHLTAKAEAHRERARVMAELVPEILAFDDTPDGERLRRFDLASGRGLARSLGELRRHRSSSVVSGPLSVVSCKGDAVEELSAPNEYGSCPLSAISCKVRAIDEPGIGGEAAVESGETENTTNEPTGARENATNEPTGVRENTTNEPTVAHENETNEATAVRENTTNEPTVAHENVTNEPTVGPLSVVRCPLPVASCADQAVYESVTNEPTVAREIVTNEPTVGPLSVVGCPLPVASCADQAVYESVTNEPTEARENATKESTGIKETTTNEPKLAADGDDGHGYEAEPTEVWMTCLSTLHSDSERRRQGH